MTSAAQPTTPSTADARRWFGDGEALLLTYLVDGRDELSAPSLLPGWTRAHVAAHLVGNAIGLGHLVTWAATGVETPMYASQEARDEQIENESGRPAEELRRRVREGSTRLVTAFDALSDEQRAARIRTNQGRDRAAAEIAWMRARESHVHLVDLDVGYGFADLPGDLVDALLDDATASIGQRPGAPSVVLRPDDREQAWPVGPAPATVEVTGPAADLLAWVLGRPGPRRPDWPILPAWL